MTRLNIWTARSLVRLHICTETLINSDIPNSPLNVPEMVVALKSSGLDTKKSILEGLLVRRKESFPPLAWLATSQEYWNSDSVDRWAPICAIHLLARMKHYGAQLAVISAILDHTDDASLWISGDALHVLAHMGAGAIPTLTALLRYRGIDMYVRYCTAQALNIRRQNPR